VWERDGIWGDVCLVTKGTESAGVEVDADMSSMSMSMSMSALAWVLMLVSEERPGGSSVAEKSCDICVYHGPPTRTAERSRWPALPDSG